MLNIRIVQTEEIGFCKGVHMEHVNTQTDAFKNSWNKNKVTVMFFLKK